MTDEQAKLVKAMRKTLAEWDDDDPRGDWWSYQRHHAQAADAIEALRAENARLLTWPRANEA
jgi:hypothetical protein